MEVVILFLLNCLDFLINQASHSKNGLQPQLIWYYANIGADLKILQILGDGNYTRWLVGNELKGLRPGSSTRTKSFSVPTACGCKKFKHIFKHQVGFECPNHFWLPSPLKVHSYKNKSIIRRSPATSRNLEQKSQNQPLRRLQRASNHWHLV